MAAKVKSSAKEKDVPSAKLNWLWPGFSKWELNRELSQDENLYLILEGRCNTCLATISLIQHWEHPFLDLTLAAIYFMATISLARSIHAVWTHVLHLKYTCDLVCYMFDLAFKSKFELSVIFVSNTCETHVWSLIT